MVSVANFNDSKAALLLMRTLHYLFHYLLVSVKVILADGGYRGNLIEEIKDKFGYIIQVVLRSDNKEKLFKDGLLKERFLGLIMTEDFTEIMNC